MRQALHYLTLRLIGDIPQDPFELQDDGLRNEHVAGRKYARGNASLRRIIAEIEARKDVGVRCATIASFGPARDRPTD